MKSVIHEASSLACAIEEGWKKAGKPSEFTVKIYQQAEHSIFGLVTKKKAKVGIFFEDQPARTERTERTERSGQREQRDRSYQQGQGQQRPQRSEGRDGRQGQGQRDGRQDRDRQRPRRDQGQRSQFPKEVKEKSDVLQSEPNEAVKTEKKVINAFVKKD